MDDGKVTTGVTVGFGDDVIVVISMSLLTVVSLSAVIDESNTRVIKYVDCRLYVGSFIGCR